MFGLSWKYIVSGIILSFLGSFMYDKINNELTQFISYFNYYITLSVIGFLYLHYFIHQKHHCEFGFPWDIPESEPEADPKPIERKPHFSLPKLEEMVRHKEERENLWNEYNELSKKLLSTPRTYHVKMKDGTTKKILANKIQEPSVGKNQLAAKYYSPGEDALCYVLFLNGDKVAKYDQDAVEGWEMYE